MEIELRELMDRSEMLSHIFLGCIPAEDLLAIKEEFIGDKDFKKESATIPVEMKIGGVSVNPKKFFDSLKSQINRLVEEKAGELVNEKLGSEKMRAMQQKLYEYESILESWEKEINWDIDNPLL